VFGSRTLSPSGASLVFGSRALSASEASLVFGSRTLSASDSLLVFCSRGLVIVLSSFYWVDFTLSMQLLNVNKNRIRKSPTSGRATVREVKSIWTM
jgi:hypothetical protein